MRERTEHASPPHRLGFTLLEMLIVVVIASVLLAVAIPRIKTISTRQRVDRAAYLVASDMRSAFTSSARGRVPVRVQVPGDTTRYTVTNVTTDETIIRRDFAEDGVKVFGKTTPSMTMTVFPNGVATGMDTLSVSSSGYTRMVSISRVGFVRVLP